MGTITLNNDDDIERKFRELVKIVIGEKKRGNLEKQQLMKGKLWIHERTQDAIARDALELILKNMI